MESVVMWTLPDEKWYRHGWGEGVDWSDLPCELSELGHKARETDDVFREIDENG